MSEPGDDDWDDWNEEEGEQVPVTCPLCDTAAPSAPEVFQHLISCHNCDVLGTRDRLKLDFYGCIKLINYMREWRAGNPAGTFQMPARADAFAADKYMKPVLPNDPLLQYDFQPEDEEDTEVDGGDSNARWLRQESEPGSDMASVSKDDLKALFQRLHAAESAVEQMRTSFLAYREEAEKSMLGGANAAEIRDDKTAPAASKDDEDDGMDGYFKSYAHYGIHEEMLKDAVRTDSYRDAILNNRELFEGKVVLDVGCGTSILSMFAAQAGARKVYAVDNSSIASLAREIVHANGFDNVITVIRGKMEEIDLPEKVDVIISEWMGYGLLFESMLDTVLHARDKHLAPGGHVLPDKTALYVVGLCDPEGHASHVDYWKNVYSFDLTPMQQPVLSEAVVAIVPANTVITFSATLVSLDVGTCRVQDLVFTAPFSIAVTSNGALTAFCVYFDIVFEEGCANQVYFSTGPGDVPTHWKQAIFHLPGTHAIATGDIISGHVAFERAPDNPRALVIRIRYELAGLEGPSAPACEYSYRL